MSSDVQSIPHPGDESEPSFPAGAPTPAGTGNRFISVIVPTYREAEALPSLISALRLLRDAVSASGGELEVLLMDDPSGDGSEQLVAEYRESWLHYVARSGPRGLSQAVIEGFSMARGETIVVMDADLSHPPMTILEMHRRILAGADMVVASRYMRGGSTDADWGFKRWLTSKSAMMLARPLANLTDPLSGFFALPRRMLETDPRLNPVGWKIGLELIVRCRPLRIEEVPIHFRDRVAGNSKFSAREAARYLQHLRQLYSHRLRSLFTIPAPDVSPRDAQPISSRRLLYVSLIVLITSVLGLILTTIPIVSRGGLQAVLDSTGDVPRAGDFPHFYFAAKAAVEDQNIFTSWRGGYVYPPLLATALAPFVTLGLNSSAVLWYCFIFAVMVWLWAITLRELGDRWNVPSNNGVRVAASALVCLVMIEPVRSFLALAQTDSFVMLGFALPLVFLGRPSRERSMASGVAIAVSFHIKFLSLGLIPYLLLSRRWAAISWSFVGIAVVAILPALILGWERNLEYLHISLARLGHVIGIPAPDFNLFNPHPLAWERSRSILSGFARIAEQASLSNGYAYAATTLAAMIWIGIATFVYNRNGVPIIHRFLQPASLKPQLLSQIIALEMCSVIAAILALGPQTTKRHTIILIPAMLLAGMLSMSGRVRSTRWKCITGLLLLFIASLLPAAREVHVLDVWSSLGAFGGFGWALAIFSLLLLDAGLAEAAKSEVQHIESR